MTASNFKRSLALILQEEGGNDDDPHDPGGRTSRGIIQSEWNVYRRSHPGMPADVWKAPQSAVIDIYRQQYWNPYCDELPSGIDLLFFNASVNSGRQQAVKELQRALGVSSDGMMGMETLNAVNAAQDYRLLIHNMSDQRRAFYKRLKNFKYYGKGWMARTQRMEVAANGMAPAFNATQAIADISDGDMTTTLSAKRAMPEGISAPTVSPEVAGTVSAGSATGTGAVDQIQSISDTLSPFQDVFKWVKIALIVLAVAMAIVTVYAIIQRRRNEAVT